VTRVILVPQGQFVTFSALTFGLMQQGERPGTFLFLAAAAVAGAAVACWRAARRRRARDVPRILAIYLVGPATLAAISLLVAPDQLGNFGQVMLTLAIVVPLGPLLHRLVFEPMADSSVLMLLIVSVAVDVAMGGIGLLLFGSEGARTDPLLDVSLDFGAVRIGGSTLAIIGVSLVVMLGLYLFFGRTVTGKALRATAYNALGARLVGIRVRQAGGLAFTLAALLGAVSGILVSSVMTVYYDSGFMIGLKGFIAAIVGGLVSYPAAVAGALVIGLLEAWSAFYASAFKEVIVFTALIPVLVARSMFAPEIPDEEVTE